MKRLLPFLSILALIACQKPNSPDKSQILWQPTLSENLVEFAPGIISTTLTEVKTLGLEATDAYYNKGSLTNSVVRSILIKSDAF
ncbi:MAG: hypothetical protein AB8H47_28185 [Bacteroidia bacterium]